MASDQRAAKRRRSTAAKKAAATRKAKASANGNGKAVGLGAPELAAAKKRAKTLEEGLKKLSAAGVEGIIILRQQLPNDEQSIEFAPFGGLDNDAAPSVIGKALKLAKAQHGLD